MPDYLVQRSVEGLKALQKYHRIFQMGLKNAMEYRANFLLGIFSVIFPVTIQFFLWKAVFSAAGKGTMYGYSYHGMIAYAITSAILVKFTAGGFEWEIADDVKNGGLSKFIVRPVGYIRYRISSFMGTKSIQASVMLVVLTAVYILLTHTFGLQLSAAHVFIFLPALFMAVILNFMILFCISMTAFWLNEVWGIFVIFNLLNAVVCGGVFPLDLFGKTVLKVFDYLPFKYVIYYPVNILTGRMNAGDGARILLLQLLWIAGMTLMVNILWAMGMKKYTAAGG